MERWQLSTKEVARYSVIENAIKGYLKASQAAEQLHLSTRQVFRLKKALRKEGIVGLIHGNRGRSSPHKISEEIRDKVDSLYQGKYAGFNVSHFTSDVGGKRDLMFISGDGKAYPA
jgi:transposase